MEIIEVILRGIASLITLFLVTKMLGKKQVSQLSIFDYVMGISIGNFAAEITINLDTPVIYGIISMLVFGSIAYIISILTMKSIILRRFFMGVPTILIQNGKILMKGLKQVKFDVNDLLEECRNSGYFDLNDIDTAIMEVNGKLSFIPKANNRPVTTKDMSLNPEQDKVLANVILDGHIMVENLSYMNKNIKWLNQQLKIKGAKLENILLATLDNNEKLSIYEKNVNEKPIKVLE